MLLRVLDQSPDHGRNLPRSIMSSHPRLQCLLNIDSLMASMKNFNSYNAGLIPQTHMAHEGNPVGAV